MDPWSWLIVILIVLISFAIEGIVIWCMALIWIRMGWARSFSDLAVHTVVGMVVGTSIAIGASDRMISAMNIAVVASISAMVSCTREDLSIKNILGLVTVGLAIGAALVGWAGDWILSVFGPTMGSVVNMAVAGGLIATVEYVRQVLSLQDLRVLVCRLMVS